MGGDRAEAGGIQRVEAHAVGQARRYHVENAGRDDEAAAVEGGPETRISHGQIPFEPWGVFRMAVTSAPSRAARQIRPWWHPWQG